MMKHFFCSTCNNPLKIKEGDYIFTYNTECCNNHISNNVDLENILSTKNEQIYICQNHKKKNIIHCLDCKVDICLTCFKELHNNHKMGYLKTINYNNVEKHFLELDLEEEQQSIKRFLDELKHFKNELELYINILNSYLQKYHKFKCDLYNNISPEITSYINIENIKNIFKSEKSLKIKDLIKSFLSCDVFIQRYDNLKNIFDLMLKAGKYIENEFIKDIYNKNIIPIDEKYFIANGGYNLSILEKTLDLNLKKYKFNKIFQKNTSFEINRVELKEHKDVKKKLSLYALSYRKDNQGFIYETKLYEITIENLCDCNINTIKTYNGYFNIFFLSKNNIILDNNVKICLYDESFNSPKLVSKEISKIIELIKIDSNTFIYSSEKAYASYGIFLAKIHNNNINNLQIFNCGKRLIYFFEKKKIIFSMDSNYIYLINFISATPEVIQKVGLKGLTDEPYNYFINHTELIRCLTSFNDESIYLELSTLNYRSFLIQYKLIEGELIEVSRIKMK